MPSIPQSLLWISLVVLWLFVLVPMLINKRDNVRRTSDVALATRVVNSGRVKSRLIKRSGPAAGHRHDPDWRTDDEFVEDFPDLVEAELADFADRAGADRAGADRAGADRVGADHRDVIREYDDAVRKARMGSRSRSVVVVAAVSEQSLVETDYLDVDVVEESSGALPVGGVQAKLFDLVDDVVEDLVDREHGDQTSGEQASREQPKPEPAEPITEEFAVVGTPVADADAAAPAAPETAAEPAPEPVASTPPKEAPRRGADAGEYEYIDDTSGLEDEPEAVAPLTAAAGRSASRERRMSNTAAAVVEARKYQFRKRVLMMMAVLLAASAALAFTVSPTLWWSCGAVAGVTVLYLGYLRRQTRIEEQVRRRRQHRMARSRPVVEEPATRRLEDEFTEFPTRLQRPGAVVLEIDDEDPVFEHLDEVAYSHRPYGRTQGPSRGTRDLPRASGL